MPKCAFLLLLVLQIQLMAQDNKTYYLPDGSVKFCTYFPDGSIKFMCRSYNDQFEYTRYYSSGQMKYNVFTKITPEGREVNTGTSKEFYRNGKLKRLFRFEDSTNQNVSYKEKLVNYSSGIKKYHLLKRGKDTLQCLSYYKNGQMRDSIWLYLPASTEIPLGTSKQFYSDGHLKAIVYHGKGKNEFEMYSYHKNGALNSHMLNPSGISRQYNSKNKLIFQSDQHKNTIVYVPKSYRKNRHFKTTLSGSKVKSKKAWLVNGKQNHQLKSGRLSLLQLKSDTNLLAHCLIEGFSEDSIYFTKLSYNPNFKVKRKEPILIHDSCFAIGINQISSLYYFKYNERNRNFGVLLTRVIGSEFVLLPPIESLLFVPMGDLTLKTALAISAAGAVIGIPIIYLSHYLQEKNVPKEYQFDSWKFQIEK